MQSNYLVQVYTKNPMLSVTPSGYFTIHGTMTKAKALEWLDEITPTENRKLRVISQKAFKQEIIETNRIAYNLSKGAY
jgi:hypothetical protein